ncbi:unnamed protein product [Heterobilharzia americana]|nr:unnamed protein product [Heterobilharzia americana]
MALHNSHEFHNHKRHSIRASNQVYQVEVDHKCDCQEVIDKMCKLIGIVEEAGYFGIQLAGSRNEMFSSVSSFLRVKYFVPPCTLQLEETRHQFYTNVVHHLKDGSWDAGTTLEIQSQLIALMAYVQFGNYNPNTTPCKYACFWPERRNEIQPEVIRMAARFHQDLRDVTVSHAKYELLSIVSREFSSYGTYFYDIRDIFDRKLSLGVSPNDIVLCSSNGDVIERFPFCRVHTITNSTRVVTLNLLEDDGSVKGQNYQLSSTRLAYALYRTITEVHAFFHSDSIKQSLLDQTVRESFASMFDHNGKEYAFDLRLTFLEVYDHARRRILDAIHRTGDSQTRHESSSQADSVVSVEEVQEIVQESLREVALCRVCMDKPISRVFFPCGHTICCSVCADRVDQCPICRKSIELRHPCFLPWNTESSTEDFSSLFGCTFKDISDRFKSHRSSRHQKHNSATNSILHETASAPSCNLSSLIPETSWTRDNPNNLDESYSINLSIASNNGETKVNTFTEKSSVTPVDFTSIPSTSGNPVASLVTPRVSCEKPATESSIGTTRHVTWETED